MERIAALETQCAELRCAFGRVSMQLIAAMKLVEQIADSQRMLALMHVMERDALPGEDVEPLATRKAN